MWFRSPPAHRRLAMLSAEFAATVDDGAPTEWALIGAEHEYRLTVAGRRSTALDFRALVHPLRLGRRGLDPDDPYAYRLPTGNAVTCDQKEAEIVLAPVAARPGAYGQMAARAEAERKSLAARVAPFELVGHSTHISVSVANEIVERVGRLVCSAFGSDLIRLVDSPERCGIWLRPRFGRLELCADYVDGARLAGVSTFFAAAVCAGVDAVANSGESALPALVGIDTRLSAHRPGWNLTRRSFRGGDPFADGADDPLVVIEGGTMSASDHLAASWHRLRASVSELALASEDEAGIVDELVAGHEPSPAARSEPIDGVARAFGDAVRARQRNGFGLAVVALTWQFAIFVIAPRNPRNSRLAFAVVPRRSLGSFLGRVDQGVLDETLRRYLAVRAAGRRLVDSSQVGAPGLFDELGWRRSLVPADPPIDETVELAA